MGDDRGTASKEKISRKQRCLRNSSLKSASATTTTDSVSLGDGPGGVRCRTCGVSDGSAVLPVRHAQAAAAASKPKRGGASLRASAAVAAEADLMLKSVAKLAVTFNCRFDPRMCP